MPPPAIVSRLTDTQGEKAQLLQRVVCDPDDSFPALLCRFHALTEFARYW
jgi:hypothetical protein